MDYESVTSATDDDLQELGLIAKGDILALKSFCKTRPSKESRDDTKRKLIDMIKGNNKILTLQSYLTAQKLQHPKLFLMTKTIMEDD